ncbi:hypothetical protein HMPREF0658_0299 [Hoylesella marshii DSM 16973 = JCM 13450]|uniref:Uncharacterized protein n=1 Tax=Hoylesella marshii DSM 16973 = JCM 13450 TaxID=862515 RepID=E0NQ48_9BACT|nr:hypothetical protein HMPREF0658_0299 [Hoylesella marshii DSM 16973 = JCM 13450]
MHFQGDILAKYAKGTKFASVNHKEVKEWSIQKDNKRYSLLNFNKHTV